MLPYESKPDREHVEKLNRQARNLSILNTLTYPLIAIGGWLTLHGSFKDNSRETTSGLATFLSGLSAYFYSRSKVKEISAELEKTENANVVLHGKKRTLVNKALDLVDNRPAIEGEIYEGEVIKGREEWEKRMARELNTPTHNTLSK